MSDSEHRFSVTLEELVSEFGLEVIFGPDDYKSMTVRYDDVSRPGLQLIGFFDYFEPGRIQIIGKAESTYLLRCTCDERRVIFDRLFSYHVPAVIFTRNMEVNQECLESAAEYAIPILRTPEATSAFMSALVASLKVSLAPRITRHGVLVEVYGEGILILGDSGIGKSETAIELIKLGHRLIADDAVEIKRVSAKTLVGNAPKLIRYFVELRGIGVIDVRPIFGMGAVKPTEKIDLVVMLEPWQENKAYDRLGIENEYMTILDIPVPLLTIPVKPGRNLAMIIEVAAMNNRQKKLGYDAARDLSNTIYDAISKNSDLERQQSL